MRDYKSETEKRVQWLRQKMKSAHSDGFVYGNSGGKDCTLVGILCKMACDKTIGVIMPCQSKQNYTTDIDDALAVSRQYGIETRMVDISAAKEALTAALSGKTNPAYTGATAFANINPIGDLTVREVYEFLAYLDAPTSIRTKKPSAGLWEGQTDEQELGITYDEVDTYLLEGKGTEKTKTRVDNSILNTAHKRVLTIYPD